LDAVAKIEGYLTHRADREAQVLAAIDQAGDGGVTIAALVAEIYAGYPDDVKPLAARSVLAHLRKLEAEGRVEHQGRGGKAAYERKPVRECARCGRPVKGRATLCDRCSLAALQEQPD
jgi:hypothetical protein